MNIRKTVFKLLDILKGRPVFKNIDQIKSINEALDGQLVQRYQKEQIDELLENAIKNIPFYKNIDTIELSKFPIVDKSIIKNGIDQFISPLINKSELHRMVTSGSTGTPFVSYQDDNKKKRNSADALYFGELAGFTLGEPLYYLKIWSSANRKSKIIQTFQNIIPIDVIHLSGKNISNFINKFNTASGRIHINGYASALEEICKYLDVHSTPLLTRNLKVGSIIAQSEALSNETKERLYRYYDCQPCSRYSNLENGIIAQQTLKNNTIFKINCASYYVEILKINEDIVADKGELGRIVITDLFNYSMPFIRYDSGDIGRFTVNGNGEINRSFLSEIQGRKLDLLLDTKGNIVSSYIMYKNMFKYPEIDQYQLIQEGQKEYRFVISMKEKFLKEKILTNEFLSYLGNDAIFKIEYVEEIPLLASGKRRKIVNNYLKKQTV